MASQRQDAVGPRVVRDPVHVWKHLAREPGGPTITLYEMAYRVASASRKRNPTMNVRRKSDGPIVPSKRPNKAGKPGAEGAEGRGLTKGNLSSQTTPQAQDWVKGVRSARTRVREVAKRDRKMKFTTLMHHIYSVDALREAYKGLKRTAAAGVDGVTWRSYGENLEENLSELSSRLKRGAYRAKPVKRAYITKEDGQQRPLGVTVLEDKVVQASAVAILNSVYEVDFLDFSYGFRQGRGPHDALDALTVAIERQKVNWVLDADIRGFFDSIDHDWLAKFVEHRIADKRVLRLIQKWLNAGVMEDGVRTKVEVGTPQGGVVSPLLANIYLHYVFDLWVDQWRRRQVRSDVIVVRYADDFVVGFECKSDAERFLVELGERLAKFGLELHPTKTRLIEFGRYAAPSRRRRGDKKPESFDFLGFTHYCSQTRKGWFAVKRCTMRKRMSRKLREIAEELWRRMHDPVEDVGRWLGQVMRGHTAYYGVPFNFACVVRFREGLVARWRRALGRRSQKGYVTWAKLRAIADAHIPKPHIYHPHPSSRLAVRT
jgi:RNA-directed DNA polymerase